MGSSSDRRGPLDDASGPYVTPRAVPADLDTIEIFDPRAYAPRVQETPTLGVGSTIAGKVVGLRLDRYWRSYIVIIDEWKRFLERDGAIPEVLWVGNRAGSEGIRTRTDLEEWSRLIDIGVIGLGN